MCDNCQVMEKDREGRYHRPSQISGRSCAETQSRQYNPEQPGGHMEREQGSKDHTEWVERGPPVWEGEEPLGDGGKQDD